MPQIGTIPSAIAAKDIPDALQHLKEALEADSSVETQEDDEDQEEKEVSMSGRAFPLIEMLQAAAKENEPIMWYQK